MVAGTLCSVGKSLIIQCSHCKTLRHEWAKLATKLKGVAKVAKLDASVNRQFD
jgi:hypothetical protein